MTAPCMVTLPGSGDMSRSLSRGRCGVGAMPDDMVVVLLDRTFVVAGLCWSSALPFCCTVLSCRASFFCLATLMAHTGGLQPFMVMQMISFFSCLCVFHRWRYKLRSCASCTFEAQLGSSRAALAYSSWISLAVLCKSTGPIFPLNILIICLGRSRGAPKCMFLCAFQVLSTTYVYSLLFTLKKRALSFPLPILL